MNQPVAETIFWIAAAACIVAEIAILRSTFAAKPTDKSELVPAASRSGELAWAIVPAIALSVVLVATWRRVESRESHMQTMDHSQMSHQMPMPMTPAEPQR
jgi:membrane protein implicated in regulation of membrane protease activity